MHLGLSEGYVNEDLFVSSDEGASPDSGGDVYGYVSSISDLDLGRYSGLGIGMAGTAILFSLLVVSVISWLKRG